MKKRIIRKLIKKHIWEEIKDLPRTYAGGFLIDITTGEQISEDDHQYGVATTVCTVDENHTIIDGYEKVIGEIIRRDGNKMAAIKRTAAAIRNLKASRRYVFLRHFDPRYVRVRIITEKKVKTW